MTIARSVASGVARGVASAVTRGQGASGSSSFDYIGASSIAAFDIAALKTGITTCFRARRSSDNTEQDCLTVAEAVAFASSGSAFVASATDQTGNSRTAIQTTTTNQPRIVNSGLGDAGFVCDGTNDALEFAGFTLEAPYTICVRFNAASFTGPKGVVSWGEEAANKRRSLIVWNGGAGAYKVYSSQYANNIAGATSLSTGVWYHAAITVAAGGATVVYLNGASDGTGTHSPATPTSQPLRIARTGDANEFFNGTIRDVRIYNVVKTAGEILAIYASVTP